MNGIVDRAIYYFTEYLSTLNDDQTGQPPSKYPYDSARPALAAHFHLARLCDKHLLSNNDAKRRLDGKIASLSHFRTIVDYCERNPDHAEAVAVELPVCVEMAKLLPLKIAKMEMELKK